MVAEERIYIYTYYEMSKYMFFMCTYTLFLRSQARYTFTIVRYTHNTQIMRIYSGPKYGSGGCLAS